MDLNKYQRVQGRKVQGNDELRNTLVRENKNKMIRVAWKCRAWFQRRTNKSVKTFNFSDMQVPKWKTNSKKVNSFSEFTHCALPLIFPLFPGSHTLLQYPAAPVHYVNSFLSLQTDFSKHNSLLVPSFPASPPVKTKSGGPWFRGLSKSLAFSQTNFS